MINSRVNNFGVLIDYNILEEHKDKFISYSIRMAFHNDMEHFACSVTISGFGIYSGFRAVPSIDIQSSLEEQRNFIKNFLERGLENSLIGKKHISTIPILQSTKQLSLFD